MDYDFQASFNYIKDNKIKNKEYTQRKVLNSATMNLALNQIENNFNLLYEKTRCLEDVMNYSSLYLKNEINSNIDECKNLIRSIEANRDSIKNSSYVKYLVPLVFGATTTSDRNEDSLHTSYLFNNNIIPAFSVLSSHNLLQETLRQTDKASCLVNNFDTFDKENSYRSFYMFEDTKGDNIYEELVFSYKTPILINRISYNVTNCNIHSFLIKTQENKEVEIFPSDASFFNELYALEIVVRIKTSSHVISNYNYKEYTEETVKVFWDNYNKKDKYDFNNKKYYYYLFGIDNLKFENVSNIKNSFFISKDIQISSLKDQEYITIDTKHSGNIEFSILDNTIEIPILPEGVTEVIDERLFYKTSLRFQYDAAKDVLIKCNGEASKVTLQEAIDTNDGNIYTASYTPVQSLVKTKGSNIKVKAILRDDISDISPIVNDIRIKKYGGGIIWIDKV